MAVPVHAQDGIRRCIGSNGEPVFSDRPCTPASARPRERAAEDAYHAPLEPTTQTCSTSPAELRDRVAAALDARNAIALSGLMLWDGYGRGDATATLKQMARLVEEPLISITLDRAAARYDDPYDVRPPRRAGGTDALLVIRTARHLDHVPEEGRTDFEIVDRRGCWWLQGMPSGGP